MPISALLDRERIDIVPEPLDRDGVLDRAAGLLARPASGPGLPVAELARHLRERERLASTGIGHGVAIPHGRLGSLETTRGAFLRLCQPVDFGAADGRAVDLVFALAVPEHATTVHLAQLAEIAERFSGAGFRDAVREAADPSGLARLLLEDTFR